MRLKWNPRTAKTAEDFLPTLIALPVAGNGGRARRTIAERSQVGNLNRKVEYDRLIEPSSHTDCVSHSIAAAAAAAAAALQKSADLTGTAR